MYHYSNKYEMTSHDDHDDTLLHYHFMRLKQNCIKIAIKRWRWAENSILTHPLLSWLKIYDDWTTKQPKIELIKLVIASLGNLFYFAAIFYDFYTGQK